MLVYYIMKKPTKKEQRKMYDALPESRKKALAKHCKSCEQRGEGIMDILKSVGKFLGPVAKELGPVVLKEILMPLVKKKVGLDGKGLKLAGEGKKKTDKKKKKK